MGDPLSGPAQESAPPGWRFELRKLTTLAMPVIATQLGSMLMGTVDTLMVSRVSVHALASAAIANAWIYGCLLAAQGVVHGIDPIVTRAHGAGDGRRAGLACQRGVVLALLLSLPIALLWTRTEAILLFMGQDPLLAQQAGRYTWAQIPSIPFFLVFVALRQYLQGRELVRPAMWVMLAGNVFNAAANWVLIFGKLGCPELGLLGAGIATALSRGVLLVGLAGWVRAFSLQRGAWPRWSRRAVDPAALRRVLSIGVPVAAQMSLEIWAFSAGTLLAGRLGAAALAAHTIVLNLAATSFMVPLGISQGAVTRVGNLLGTGAQRQAQRAAWVAMAAGAGVMCLSAAGFVVLRNVLPRLYTDDRAVLMLAASILPIAGAFQIFDGTQVVGCGILRGMGHTRPAAWLNLLGYWVLGIPLAAWLALSAGFGLRGIWWGYCVGLSVVAAGLIRWVQRRGPASEAAARHEAAGLPGPSG